MGQRDICKCRDLETSALSVIRVTDHYGGQTRRSHLTESLVLFICFRLFVSMSTTVSVWRVFVQDIVNIFLFLRVWKSLLVMRGKQTRLLAFHLTVVWVELTPTQHVNQFPTSCSTDLLLPSSSVRIHRNQTCKKTSVSVSELGIDGESCGVTPYFLFEHQIK